MFLSGGSSSPPPPITQAQLDLFLGTLRASCGVVGSLASSWDLDQSIQVEFLHSESYVPTTYTCALANQVIHHLGLVNWYRQFFWRIIYCASCSIRGGEVGG